MFCLNWCKDISLGFWDIEITQWEDSVILLFTHDRWLLRNTLSTVLCFLDYIIKSKSLVANIKINITISYYCECNFLIKIKNKNWIWSNDEVGIRSNFCYLNNHHKSVYQYVYCISLLRSSVLNGRPCYYSEKFADFLFIFFF